MMFDNTRQKKIFDIVSKKGSVSVDFLAKHFRVSKMTIRRDLEKLQEEDLLQRTHGGAMLPQVLFKEMTYLEKQTQNIEVKRKIATDALEYVVENSVIYLDAGTTTFELAKHLVERKDVQVVTNDLRIASHLANAGVRVYMPGGLVSSDTGSIHSAEAIDFLENLNIDIAFLAASTVDNELNVCTPNEEKVLLKRYMIKNVPMNVLLVDSSKFHQKAIHRVFNLSEVDYVVTDYKGNLEVEKKG